MYHTQVKIRFKDADPAGIMFFANVFDIAHDVFEEFIQAAGFSWEEYFESSEYAVPLRHVEADYKSPLRPGHSYDVGVEITNLGQSSVTFKYQFYDDHTLCCDVTMVHTFINPSTHKKISIPADVRKRLEHYKPGIA